MINDYKKELMYAQILERFAFDTKWAQKFKSKEHPLPIGQYWHLDYYPDWEIYDKETNAPMHSLARNSVPFWAYDWMDAEWEKAFTNANKK